MNSAVKVHSAAIRAADRRRAAWLVQSKERHKKEAGTQPKKERMEDPK